MEGQPYFRFDIELTEERNPPGVMDRLREDLRAWIVSQELGYAMGALGGDRHLYGEIGPEPAATDEIRAALAEWVRGQRVCATVRLEAVVPFSESSDMLAPITDWVFAVDTLTETERAEATAYYSELGRRLDALPAKRAESGAAPGRHVVRGSLLDVIDRLDEVDDSNRQESPCLFAEGGPDAAPTARALICPGDEEASFVCPQDPALSYVLEVQQAKECIEVWSEWREGRRPTPQDKFAAVMYYASHDAWLPLE